MYDIKFDNDSAERKSKQVVKIDTVGLVIMEVQNVEKISEKVRHAGSKLIILQHFLIFDHYYFDSLTHFGT